MIYALRLNNSASKIGSCRREIVGWENSGVVSMKQEDKQEVDVELRMLLYKQPIEMLGL
jgi:hypothetical protein